MEPNYKRRKLEDNEIVTATNELIGGNEEQKHSADVDTFGGVAFEETKPQTEEEKEVQKLSEVASEMSINGQVKNSFLIDEGENPTHGS